MGLGWKLTIVFVWVSLFSVDKKLNERYCYNLHVRSRVQLIEIKRCVLIILNLFKIINNIETIILYNIETVVFDWVKICTVINLKLFYPSKLFCSVQVN